MLRDGFAVEVHSTEQSVVDKQQWVTGFHCSVVKCLIVYQLGTLHNGENESQKRQFLALGVCSQSWKLNNLSKEFSCQIDWCYKLLAII